MNNTNECPKRAKKEGNKYLQYVKMVYETTCKNVNVTLKRFLLLNGFKKPEEKQQEPIECYHGNLGKFDKKMLAYYNSTNNRSNVVHLWIYYDGVGDSFVFKRGFDSALVDKIRPRITIKL